MSKNALSLQSKKCCLCAKNWEEKKNEQSINPFFFDDREVRAILYEEKQLGKARKTEVGH